MAKRKAKPRPEPELFEDVEVAPWLKQGPIDPALLGALGALQTEEAPQPELPEGELPLLGHERTYLLNLVREMTRRQCEALRIYRPMPGQVAFHECKSRQRLIYGSNRSGKTSAAAVELARAVTGCHPDKDRFPAKDGRAIIVAKDQAKIGEVVWYKLGRAGAFKMCFDPDTGWRIFDPATDPQKGLVPKPAPPLIPPRMIRDIAWLSKKKGIPDKVVLKNGWELNFYSSLAVPDSIQGMDVDVGWFDEEIENEKWYPEVMARLVDRNGDFWWSATPEVGTPALFELHLRAQDLAEDEKDSGKVPLITEHFLSIFENDYLDEQAKQDFVASLTEEQQQAKVHGRFIVTSTFIFDAYFFPRGVHAVDPFEIPASWTRFCAIDPGSQVCAVLFATCPPMRPEPGSNVNRALYGDFVYVYDEIYIRHCDAAKFAHRLKATVGDQEMYAYLFDHHGGRLTEIGSGLTPEQQYIKALKAIKMRPFTDGKGFTYGSDDLDGGILRVKEFLRVRDDGTPRLRVITQRCPNLVREMQRYQWKCLKGVVEDKPLKRHDHTPDCLRYICMYPRLRWQKPREKPKVHTAWDAYMERKKQRVDRQRAESGYGVTLG